MYTKTYNLEEVLIKTIKSVIKDFPNQDNEFYSIKLGVSERTFYRYKKKYKLDTLMNNSKVNKAIALLSEKGYKVII